jgi:hypothetical protein
MAGIVASLDPGFADKIVDADIIEPRVIEVLATDYEETVTADRREVGITRSRGKGI